MFLECRNIAFKYPQAEALVFDDLSFKIQEPGLHAVFGPSGVGKTSLARIITGDIKDYTGQVATSGLGTLLYSYNLERLPGWSSVGRHLNKITSPAQKDKSEELIDIFGLEPIMGMRFSQLSLGQKNRINLIRYLFQDFHLLIMDESLANVDEKTREIIILKIKEMFPRKLFLYISHNVVEVAKFCNKIIILRQARRVPQVAVVSGQDLALNHRLEKDRLEQTMLEIMNAA